MKICEQCGAMLDAEERCACGRDAVLPPHRSFAHLTAVAEEWRFLLRAGAAACAEARIEPMRKAYEKNRQIKLSIPALVAALWIIRGFAAVRKADGIVSGFII